MSLPFDLKVITSRKVTLESDVDRTALLATTRRVTLVLMASMPLFAIALAALFQFGEARWSSVIFSAVTAGMFVVGLFTAELWRRLESLSQLADLNKELHRLATHDQLMEVPNREQLRRELADALDARGSVPHSVGLLFLDLDRFKSVNDTFGHRAGDELLKAVGLRVEEALVDEDAMLARVGGDEMVVLMRSLNSVSHLVRIANRVIDTFADPFVIEGVSLTVGSSIGMAASLAGEDAEDLYRHADAALYEAKERGRGQAVLADVRLRTKLESRVRTERAFRTALDDGDIEAWLQPEVDLVTGEVVAAEALARWRTSDGIEIASSFIDVAQRAGLLDELMIEMAGQVWEWRASSGSTLPIALNVSAAHLPTLLALHHADPASRPFEGLRLEIPETDIIHDFEGTRKVLAQARELGAQILLDDFGAGYSSVQMLSDLPIDGIKIDRSYVARIQTDWRVRSLVTSLADFARSTNMIVVAEGVATAKQADFLTSMGIDRGQGFLFSRAVDPTSFENLVARGNLSVDHAGAF